MKNEIKKNIEKFSMPLMIVAGLGLTLFGAIQLMNNLPDGNCSIKQVITILNILPVSYCGIEQTDSQNILMSISGAIMAGIGAKKWVENTNIV